MGVLKRILTFEVSTLPLLFPIPLPPFRASPEVVSWQPAFRHPDPLSQKLLWKWVIAPAASQCPRTFEGLVGREVCLRFAF